MQRTTIAAIIAADDRLRSFRRSRTSTTSTAAGIPTAMATPNRTASVVPGVGSPDPNVCCRLAPSWNAKPTTRATGISNATTTLDDRLVTCVDWAGGAGVVRPGTAASSP